jgi:hypothetical protein
MIPILSLRDKGGAPRASSGETKNPHSRPLRVLEWGTHVVVK